MDISFLHGMMFTPEDGGASSLLTDIVSWHSLEEASGTRADSHGSNDLTDNNTVTQVVGGGPGGQDCAQFTAANDEFLSISDAAQSGIDPLNTNWTESIWVRFDSLSGNRVFTSKFDGSGQNSWLLRFDSATGEILVRTSVDGTSGTFNSLGFSLSISIDTWYNTIWWHDADNNEIGLVVNNGTPATAAQDASGIFDSTSGFAISGFADGGGAKHDGRAWGHGVWSRLLTSQEITDLYNSGSGLAYPF